MSCSIAEKLETKGSVVLTTGLGLSDQGVPVRLPALLVPGLEVLRELVGQGREASYVVYQATDFIIQANGLAGAAARENAATMETYMDRFVSRYYADVAEHVVFRTGCECAVDDRELGAVEAGLAALEKEEAPAFKTPEIAGAFDLIRAYGERHAGANVCMRYAAANVLLNGGFAGSYPFARRTMEGVTVVPLGGQREAPFFALTSAMSVYTGCSYDVQPALVPTGKMPAYYPCPDGDLLLGQPVSGFKPPRRTREDFKVLETLGASVDSLQALMAPVRGGVVRPAGLCAKEVRL